MVIGPASKQAIHAREDTLSHPNAKPSLAAYNKTASAEPREEIPRCCRKTALVTGSTSGIGLALATAFARAGCNVVLNGLATRTPSTRCAQGS